MALVCHVKTAAELSVGVARVRVTSASFYVRPTAAAAAATRLAWLVSRGRGWQCRPAKQRRVDRGPGSLFTRTRRRHEAMRHDRPRQTCYSLRTAVRAHIIGRRGDTSALLVFRRQVAVLLINSTVPGHTAKPDRSTVAGHRGSTTAPRRQRQRQPLGTRSRYRTARHHHHPRCQLTTTVIDADTAQMSATGSNRASMQQTHPTHHH